MKRGFCRRKNSRTKGAMELSFGMIFSIILIIAFVAFTFFVVKKFLDFKDTSMIGKFGSEFQTNVNTIWAASSESSQTYEYIVPGKIQGVCIWDSKPGAKVTDQKIKENIEIAFYGEENTFLYPNEKANDLGSKKVDHLDIEKITFSENPYCIKTNEGKVKIKISKADISETKVMISRGQ